MFFTCLTAFTIISEGSLTKDICITNDRRSVSYFKVNIEETQWDTALQECVKQESILPVICNKNEQDALVKYLNSTKGMAAVHVWTSGKKFISPNWTWIDGQPFTGRASMSTFISFLSVST